MGNDQIRKRTVPILKKERQKLAVRRALCAQITASFLYLREKAEKTAKSNLHKEQTNNETLAKIGKEQEHQVA